MYKISLTRAGDTSLNGDGIVHDLKIDFSVCRCQGTSTRNSIEFSARSIPMQLLATVHNAIVDSIIHSHRTIAFSLQDFFASVQRVSSKTDNNRTAGEGNCYELGNVTRITAAANSPIFILETYGFSPSKSQKIFRFPKARDRAGQCDPFHVVILRTKHPP